MKIIPTVLFIPSFSAISELLDVGEVLVNIPQYNITGQKAILSKNESRGFTIEIDNVLRDMSDQLDIEILINGDVFRVSGLFISMRGTTLRRNDHKEYFSGRTISSGQVHAFTNDTEDSTEIIFRRFIIPTGTGKIQYYLDTNRFQDETYVHAFGQLNMQIDGSEFVLYEMKHREMHYFVIDSRERIGSERFADICHCILVGFGFLSADFIQNDAFYITSNKRDFKKIRGLSYLQLRPSISSKGTCNPIYSNPFGYTQDEKIIGEIGNKISVFDSAIFSTLCTKIYREPDYAALILLILEANISSLILRPAGYSVALEKITNIIIDENQGLKPIQDRELSKLFRQKLKEVLESFASRIDSVGNDDSLIILQKNIDKINNPTNRDKLIKPFGIYGINLTENDLIAIENRNNFLHGRSIKKDKNSEDYLEIFKISLRLNKLLNKLILKHIGYSGIIINHLKHNESSFDHAIDEPLFERI